MKVLCIGDLYFERVAVIGYVAWSRAGTPARPHLSMANIGKGQFPSDHCQRNSNKCECHFRPEIDRHFILSVSYTSKTHPNYLRKAAGRECCTSCAGDVVPQLDWACDGTEGLKAFTRAKDRHRAVVEHAPEN